MKRISILLVVLMTTPFFCFSQTLKDINKAIIEGLDEVAPFNEGLAAVRKGNQWGFIDKSGKLVIDFRKDLVWNKDADKTRQDVMGVRYPSFKDGRCLVKELKEEGIAHYGFIDKAGKIVIEPEYLNVTEFDQGNAIGIFSRKSFRGKSEIKVDVFDYVFTEAVVNTSGEMIWPIGERDNILMSKRRYELPELRAKLLSENLLTVKNKDNHWEIRKLDL
ncbi:WG repeat-containing protein [Maribacter halichondriae]|uniref:WG repeat-containing protein n=1 Tax=Maribacter halichondriae TaxID=2980554 RepID=UPI002359FB37|nr:WG repeat-containing protein [Maribacter sp. Hal144]